MQDACLLCWIFTDERSVGKGGSANLAICTVLYSTYSIYITTNNQPMVSFLLYGPIPLFVFLSQTHTTFRERHGFSLCPLICLSLWSYYGTQLRALLSSNKYRVDHKCRTPTSNCCYYQLVASPNRQLHVYQTSPGTPAVGWIRLACIDASACAIALIPFQSFSPDLRPWRTELHGNSMQTLLSHIAILLPIRWQSTYDGAIQSSQARAGSPMDSTFNPTNSWVPEGMECMLVSNQCQRAVEGLVDWHPRFRSSTWPP